LSKINKKGSFEVLNTLAMVKDKEDPKAPFK